MAGNKFFATREPASHQRGYDHIHFAVHVDRTLTIADAKELRNVLTQLIGDEPKAEVAKPQPAPPASE